MKVLYSLSSEDMLHIYFLRSGNILCKMTYLSLEHFHWKLYQTWGETAFFSRVILYYKRHCVHVKAGEKMETTHGDKNEK